jgi:WD40 repeat protein
VVSLQISSVEKDREKNACADMQKGLAGLRLLALVNVWSVNSSEFQHWQTAVVAYNGLGRKEVVRGVVNKTALSPALRSDLNHARFSLDGKFILAQDDSGVSVLTREPLAPLFRIDAPDAKPAQFSADSKTVILYTPNLRVEVWDIAEQKLQTAYEVVLRKACAQTALSPDGKILACLDSDFGLSLAEVATGNIIFEKKSFTTSRVLRYLHNTAGEPARRFQSLVLGIQNSSVCRFRRTVNTFWLATTRQIHRTWFPRLRIPEPRLRLDQPCGGAIEGRH